MTSLGPGGLSWGWEPAARCPASFVWMATTALWSLHFPPRSASHGTIDLCSPLGLYISFICRISTFCDLHLAMSCCAQVQSFSRVQIYLGTCWVNPTHIFIVTWCYHSALKGSSMDPPFFKQWVILPILQHLWQWWERILYVCEMVS